MRGLDWSKKNQATVEYENSRTTTKYEQKDKEINRLTGVYLIGPFYAGRKGQVIHCYIFNPKATLLFGLNNKIAKENVHVTGEANFTILRRLYKN